MIKSVWKIELLTTNGTTVLLDYGDLIDGELKPRVEQRTTKDAPVGKPWGESSAEGGAMMTLNWSVQRDHESAAAARSAVMRSAANLPMLKTGTLRISIQDGEIWEALDCTVSMSEPQPLTAGPHRTLTTYQAAAGTLQPVSVLEPFTGITWQWLNDAWENYDTTNWEDL